MIPRNKLDPDQNRFLNKIAASGNRDNYWVSGFAGSGKSVLIVAALIQAKKDSPDLSVCVVLYTHSLIDLIRTGIPDDVGDVPVKTYYEFRDDPSQYDLILVDEVQDLPPGDIRRLRMRSKRLIMAGDDAQSIYDDRVDPDRLPDLANADRFPLTIIHRLPRNIVRLAKSIFPEKDLDSAKQDRLESVEPRIAQADTEEDEVEYVWTKAERHAAPGSPSAILLPSHRDIVAFTNDILNYENASAWSVTKNQWGKNDYRSLNQHLRDAGLKLRYLGNKYGRLREADDEARVFIMTYHSVKGLDFETVFIPRLNDRLTIWRDDETRSRTLFYVAFTRSRRDLYLTYSGTPHRYLQQIPETGVHRVTVPEPEPEEASDDPFDEIVF
jgi:superfamily I DNA/RNA helicase